MQHYNPGMMIRTQFVIAALCLFALAVVPGAAQQQGCPFIQQSTIRCFTDLPECSRQMVVRECGSNFSSPFCCNPAAMESLCCGESVYLAGYGGTCPPTGNKNCHFGAMVIDPEKGRTERACAGNDSFWTNVLSVNPKPQTVPATPKAQPGGGPRS